MAPGRSSAAPILTGKVDGLLHGRVRGVEYRLDGKTKTLVVEYMFIMPPNTHQKMHKNVGAAAIFKLKIENGEERTAFEARRDAAIRNLTEKGLAKKHGLVSRSEPVQPMDVDANVDADSSTYQRLAGQAMEVDAAVAGGMHVGVDVGVGGDAGRGVDSPRAQRRATDREASEQEVFDPPGTRNRAKYRTVEGLPARQRTAPNRLMFNDHEELGTKFATNRDWYREEQLRNDTNASVCGICYAGGLLFCCSSCPAAFHSKCLSAVGLAVPVDDGEDDLICAICELRSAQTEVKDAVDSEVERLETELVAKEAAMASLERELDAKDTAMASLEREFEAAVEEHEGLATALAASVADATAKLEEIETLRALNRELEEAVVEAETPAPRRRGRAKGAEKGLQLCHGLRRKGAKLEDLVEESGATVSANMMEKLVRRHVEAIFEDGHANPRRTRALIQGILENKAIDRFVAKDAADDRKEAERNARIVDGLRIYCEERRRVKAGTYKTQHAMELGVLARAMTVGDATQSDVNRATGLDRKFVRSAQRRGDGPLRRRRRDQLRLEVARAFWHDPRITRLDSNAGSKSKDYKFNGETINCYPHAQLVSNKTACELWKESQERADYLAELKATWKRLGWDENKAKKKVGFEDTMFMLSKCPCIRKERPHNCVCVTCAEMKNKLKALYDARQKGKPQFGDVPPSTISQKVLAKTKFVNIGFSDGVSFLGKVLDSEATIEAEAWLEMRARALAKPVNGCDLTKDPCRHCAAVAAADWTHETPGYWNMANGYESCYMLRRSTLCKKTRLEELDVPGSDEVQLKEASFYSPDCCIGPPDFEGCSECGYETKIGDPCPTEASSAKPVTVKVYEETKVGKEKVKEDGEIGQRTQTSLVDKVMTMKDLLGSIRADWPLYIAHYWLYTFIDFVFKVILWTFGPNVLLLQADFAAQVEHKYSGNVTCEAFAHSNVEVIVASHSPSTKEVDGKEIRTMETDCWLFIGPTNTKHKEADSHFHNVAIWTVICYYISLLPFLAYIFLETDGCAGQYKGRKWFVRVAGMAARIYDRCKRNIHFFHLFAATAHFKGFHDALGKLVDRIRADAEKHTDPNTGTTRRVSTSWDLFRLIHEKIHGFRTNVGGGLQSINRFHVYYVTSDPKDPHYGETNVIYIARTSVEINCVLLWRVHRSSYFHVSCTGE